MIDTNIPNDGTCDGQDCTEVAPWDMAAIQFDGCWLCSPACARTYLGQMDTEPASVTLHDPQFAVDRTPLPEVDEADVTLTREVTEAADAESAISETEAMFPGEFRPTPDTNVD